MRRKVMKNGNSLAVTIPAQIARAFGIREGTTLKFSVLEGLALKLEKVPSPTETKPKREPQGQM